MKRAASTGESPCGKPRGLKPAATLPGRKLARVGRAHARPNNLRSPSLPSLREGFEHMRRLRGGSVSLWPTACVFGSEAPPLGPCI
jgi:hypothetical protein